jgi:tRNA-dihydrouridine synthase
MRRQVVKTPHAALSVQVMGRELEHMALATELVTAAGADVIDLNLGCPAPNAVRKGVGSAMLADLDLLYRVVCQMRARTDAPLSAKMRAGVSDDRRAVEIAQLLEAAGADFITVHPRRQVDLFDGHPKRDIIAAIKRAVSVPVVGNGDLWHARDALDMMQATGCDAVMIGRPALKNPWIFAQLAQLLEGQPPFEPDGNALLDHFDRYVSTVRVRQEAAMLGLLKEQLRYSTRSMAGGKELLRRLYSTRSLGDLWSLLNREVSGLSAAALGLGAVPLARDSTPAPGYAPALVS